MKLLTALIFSIVFSTFLALINPSKAYAVICNGATRSQTPCTSLTGSNANDACGRALCSCEYTNGTFSDGTPGACKYDQDELCTPGPPCANTPPVTCSTFCVPSRNGTNYSYQNCWDTSTSACTGRDGNQCGFCQGWFYCACSNGDPVQVACNPDIPDHREKGCGTDSLPCAGSNSYNAVGGSCAPPPPVYTCTGNNNNGQPLSCQNGNSCPSEYEPASDTSKTCAPNTVCCSPQIICTYPPTSTVDCDVPVNPEAPCTRGIQYLTGTKPPCPPPGPPNCPEGPAIGGLIYSCQGGNSCPNGYYPTSKTCSSGQVCCMTPTAILPPQNPDEGYCSVYSALKTGKNSGKATLNRSGFDRIDWYLNTQGQSPVFHHTTNVSSSNNQTDTSAAYETTFSNLTATTNYTVTAKGWCQNCAKYSRNCMGKPSLTTDPNSPGPGSGSGSGPLPNLKCWALSSCFSNCDVGRWATGDTGGRSIVTPNFNLNGKQGEGCYRPGAGIEEPPSFGHLGGKVYVVNSCASVASLIDNTATLTQPPDFGNVIFWVWSFQDNGGPMCTSNNGQYCQLRDDYPSSYTSQSNVLLGTINSNDAAPLYSGNSVTLISWDYTRYKPIGYYRYQKAYGNNCFNGENGVECTSHACKPIDPMTDQTGQTIGREFFYWGAWLCDGCTGPPGYSKPAMTNNFYPNPDAPFCVANDPKLANDIGGFNPNARIDFVFQDVGGIFGDVSGYVYFDANKNGVQDGGENAGVEDVTINLSGVGSTQTNNIGHYIFTNVPAGDYSLSALTPDGYKLTSPQSVNVVVGCTSLPAQNFMARVSYYIKGVVKNDLDLVNGCLDSDPTFAGTVSLYNLIANRLPVSLTGGGDYIFDDLPVPQSPGATYTSKVIADIGTGITYQQIVTVPPSQIVDFCIKVPEPWVETLNGDVHSNTEINLPKGVSP